MPDDRVFHCDPPIVTSKGMVVWEGIVVEHRRQAPQEAALAPMTDHFLGLVIESPFYYWRDIGDEIKEGLRVPGSTSFLPAGRARQVRWESTADVLCLHLSPQFLEQVAEPFLATPQR